MLRPQAVALELLAYKIGDYVRGVEPKGGTGSMWQLMDQLRSEADRLDPAERRRLGELARHLDEHERSKPKSATDTLESLVLGHDPALDAEGVDTDPTDMLVVEALQLAPAPAAPPEPARQQKETDQERVERGVLQRMAEQVWWDDLDRFIQRTAASWRADRERVTPRLLYGTLQNLERYRTIEGFESDVNLRRFKVTVPIPERNDPLVSFSDPDSLAEIARDVIETILSARRDRGLLSSVDIPTSNALPYVREAANRVSQDPYAGNLSLIATSGPSVEQFRIALRELAKDRISDAQKVMQRRDLEKRLAEVQAHERSQRQMFQRDTHRFGENVHGFFERLSDQLPPDVGGRGQGPQLPTAVLLGVNPGLRVDRVPPGAEAVTARVPGPIRFAVGGVDVAVTGRGKEQALSVAGQELPMHESQTVLVDDKRVDLYVMENYLHVRVRPGRRSLASLMAEAIVVFYVLSQPERDDLLATLALVSNAIRGEPPNLIAAAIDRIGAISADAPKRRDAIEGLVRGSARAVGASLDENVIMGLVQRLHVAITAESADLPMVMAQVDGANTRVHQLGGAPITVEVAGKKLTLREYEGGRGHGSSVVVMLPGHVLGSFTDYFLEPFSGGTLLCGHAEDEVVVAFVPDATIAIPRAV